MSQFDEFKPNDAHDEAVQPDQSRNQPPQIPPMASSRQQPRQERLRHVLYGSLEAIENTIKTLHARRYADPGDWSDPIPFNPNGSEGFSGPEQWMVIMTKILLLD
jgi:hypothetical protein